MANEDLLARLQRMQRASAQAGIGVSRTQRRRGDAGRTSRFLGGLAVGIAAAYGWTVKPAWAASRWVTRLLWKAHLWLWFRTVVRDERVVRWRAGTFTLLTLTFWWFLALPTLALAYDAAVYGVTVREDEHLVLFGSQELDPWTGNHNVEGASAYPWSEATAIYFRTERSWFNQLWSLKHRGALFWPEYVAAAVPYGVSSCAVTSYGWRWRFLWINTYSDLLSVSCVPYEGNKR